jgi:hypothetical protein
VAEYFPIYYWVNLAGNVLLIFLQLIIAGIVFFRFRATPAGLLMGGTYAGFSFIVVITMVVGRFLAFDSTLFTVSSILVALLDALLTILLAVGIGLIPMSLGKLAAKNR